MTALQNRCALHLSFGATMMMVLMGLTTPAMALTDAECSELIRRPDVYASGALSEPHRTALVASGRAVFENGEVGRMTVMNGCVSGAFDKIEAQTTADLPSQKMQKKQ